MKELELLGRAIKIRRFELGLKQEELALKISMGRAHISNIENGSTSVGAERLIYLARALKLKPSELWQRAESIQAENESLWSVDAELV